MNKFKLNTRDISIAKHVTKLIQAYMRTNDEKYINQAIRIVEVYPRLRLMVDQDHDSTRVDFLVDYDDQYGFKRVPHMSLDQFSESMAMIDNYIMIGSTDDSSNLLTMIETLVKSSMSNDAKIAMIKALIESDHDESMVKGIMKYHD